MNKKVIIVIVVALIILSCFSFKIVKENKLEETEVTCFTFDSEKGEIIDYSAICGSEVKIPNKIDGVGVKGIAKYAFKDKDIKKIELPESLEEIGIAAFENNKIEKLIIPEGVKVIKPMAFYNNKINDLTLPKVVERIGMEAFNKNELDSKNAFIYMPNTMGYDKTVLIGYGGKDKDVVIPEEVTVLYISALSECELESVTLNSKLERIQSNSLSENNLSSIIIPENVIILEENSLDGNNLKEVFIKGKKDINEFSTFDKNLVSLVKFKE